MEIEHLISYLFQVKGYIEGGEKKLMTEPIDEVIRCLEEGKKYEAIVNDIEKALSPGGAIEYDFNYENYLRNNAPDEIYIKFMRDCIKKIKQKYFPKPIKKTITIDIDKMCKELQEMTNKLLREYFPIKDDEINEFDIWRKESD